MRRSRCASSPGVGDPVETESAEAQRAAAGVSTGPSRVRRRERRGGALTSWSRGGALTSQTGVARAPGGGALTPCIVKDTVRGMRGAPGFARVQEAYRSCPRARRSVQDPEARRRLRGPGGRSRQSRAPPPCSGQHCRASRFGSSGKFGGARDFCDARPRIYWHDRGGRRCSGSEWNPGPRPWAGKLRWRVDRQACTQTADGDFSAQSDSWSRSL